MYRILFFVLLFAVLIPLVWRMVNRIFAKVSNELADDSPDASSVIGAFASQKRRMEERQRKLEKSVRKNGEQIDRLNNFQK